MTEAFTHQTNIVFPFSFLLLPININVFHKRTKNRSVSRLTVLSSERSPAGLIPTLGKGDRMTAADLPRKHKSTRRLLLPSPAELNIGSGLVRMQ
jgi:hypothetical protein